MGGILNRKSAVDMRDAYFETLVELALGNPNAIILTADHGAFGLKRFEELRPQQFINCGIAEQNMVSVATGLALEGKKVFVYGIAPFLSLRALEQITIDVCLHAADVTFVSVGAGFTYATDGPTHHGLQELSVVLTVPDLRVMNCSSPSTSRYAARQSFDAGGPLYVRVEKGLVEEDDIPLKDMSNGFVLRHEGTSRTAIVSTGLIPPDVVDLAIRKNVTLVDLFSFNYCEVSEYVNYLCTFNKIICVEEGYAFGLTSVLARLLMQKKWIGNGGFHSISVPHKFVCRYGTRDHLRELNGLGLHDIEVAIDE